MNELDIKIKRFYEIKSQLEELTKEKDTLSEEIKSLMIENGIDDYIYEDIVSKLVPKTTLNM